MQCAGFSLQQSPLLRRTGSRACSFSSSGTWALEQRLNSCNVWAYLLCGMWDVPESGTELMSPALTGRFLTTEPPGKPQNMFLLILCCKCCSDALDNFSKSVLKVLGFHIQQKIFCSIFGPSYLPLLLHTYNFLCVPRPFYTQ